jgi:hypothetical protein
MLVATMLPAGKLTSPLTMVTGLFLLSWINSRVRPSAKVRIVLISLVGASMVSSCSPLFTNGDQGVINICEESTGQECKVGTATGWSLFGIPVRDIDICHLFSVTTTPCLSARSRTSS